MIRSYIIYADNVPANLVKAQQPADAVKAVAAQYLNGEKITAVDAMIAPFGDVQRLCASLGYRLDLQPETSRGAWTFSIAGPFEDKQEIILPLLSAFGRRAEDRKP